MARLSLGLKADEPAQNEAKDPVKGPVDWRQILGDSCLVKTLRNKEKVIQRHLRDFDPFPAANIQRKINYFFLPYSPRLNIGKHINFDDTKKHWQLRILDQFIEQAKSSLSAV